MLTRAQKEEKVGVFREKFSRATSVFVADYRGLKVSELNKLRGKILSDGNGAYEYCVAKNSLLRRASEGLPAEGIHRHLAGPTAIAISFGDPVGLAKILVDFKKTNEKFEIQGAVVDGSELTPEQVAQLAELPSMDQLRSKIIGLLNAPATKLAQLLQAPGAQIARVVSARSQQEG